MTVEVIVALAVASATQVAFGLGSKWFRNAKQQTPAKLFLSVTALVVTAVQLLVIALSPSPGLVLLAIGTVLYLLAAAGYWWARLSHGKDRPNFAYIPTTPTFLTQSGPYRLVRHPIYTAYLLAWLAGPVICGQPWLLLSTLVMAAIYFHAARQEEKWFAGSQLAEDYGRYRGRTGMFIPNPLAMWRR